MATFQNQATLSYNGNTRLSNTTTGTIVTPVSMTKVALNDVYTTGSEIPYTIAINNSGNSPIENVTLTDDLGSYNVESGTAYVPLNYIPGSLRLSINGTPAAIDEPTVTSPLTIADLSIPANGFAMITYRTTVNQYGPLDPTASITNQAQLSSITNALLAEATATITPSTVPALTINKSMSPTSVSSGDTLTYTFILQNTSGAPTTAADTLILSDRFSPILKNISVVVDNTTLSPDQYTYDADGNFATVNNVITVPAATFTQDPTTGTWTTTPGITTVTISGTV